MKARPVTVVLTAAIVAASILFSLATVFTVSADSTYHSEHIDLMPVGDAPLRSGFVENIHVNGPMVYAIERYVLNGAVPDTTFQVALHIHWPGSACSTEAVTVVESATVLTNVSGNGSAQVKFAPEDAAPLKAMSDTYEIRWAFTNDGALTYETPCTMITLD